MKDNISLKKELKDVLFTVKYIFGISPLYIVLILFSSLFNAAYSLFNIVIVKLIVDSIQASDKNSFCLYIVLIVIVGVFTITVNAILNNITVPKILNSIRNEIYRMIFVKYMEYDYEQVNTKEFYDSYFYVLENSEESFVSIVKALGDFITSLITIIGVVYLVANYNYFVIVCILVLVLVSFLCSIKIEKTQYNFRIDTTLYRRKADYIRRIFYLPDYFKDLRVNNVQLFYESLDDAYGNIMLEIKKWGRILSIFSFLSNISITVLNVLTIIVFGIKAITGIITIGTFTMLYSGTQKLSSSLMQFFSVFQNIYQNNLNIRQFNKFMNYEKASSTKKTTIETQRINSIELKNVSYKYLDSDILKDLSVSFQPGVMNFIVGKNGTGKSTLAHLIAGILKSQKGEVLFNDVQLTKESKQSYTNNIAVVFQDFKLYNFNLLQNISMKYEIKEEDETKIADLIKMVRLDSKLSNLKNELFTELSGEFSKDGTNFSLGELQRISLSRALYKNTDILILDEFTSFSDSEVKENILKSIRNLYKDRIVIMITHDYSYIQNTDRIICLNRDGSYNVGNIDELLSIENCDFSSLYNTNN